jgi:biotin synthase
MLTKTDIARLLNTQTPDEIEELKARAYDVMTATVGATVYYRGIIELSNICRQNCLYCGIRASNRGVDRYLLPQDEAVEAAVWCAGQGYGSIVIQSGERQDAPFIDRIEGLILDIKARTTSKQLPNGLGITLSIGEQPLDVYERLRAAGAHRYLLRIETSCRPLFEALHPPEQSFDRRLQALADLRTAGYQVGTGVMIGLPGQTVEMLAEDVLFFKDMDVDMVGMGPFIPHRATPLAGTLANGFILPDAARLQLALNMIAVTRLVCPDINIAATTALQAIVPNGRERGLMFGANVTMPNLTPARVRRAYALYDGKPCLEESKTECRACLQQRVASTGRHIGFDKWGDAPHALNRHGPEPFCSGVREES